MRMRRRNRWKRKTGFSLPFKNCHVFLLRLSFDLILLWSADDRQSQTAPPDRDRGCCSGSFSSFINLHGRLLDDGLWVRREKAIERLTVMLVWWLRDGKDEPSRVTFPCQRYSNMCITQGKHFLGITTVGLSSPKNIITPPVYGKKEQKVPAFTLENDWNYNRNITISKIPWEWKGLNWIPFM